MEELESEGIKEDAGLPPDYVDPSQDPFHPSNVGTIQFIMLARIYDLLMLDLMDRKPETAMKVLETHRAGSIIGPAPVLNGQFMSDETTTED